MPVKDSIIKGNTTRHQRYNGFQFHLPTMEGRPPAFCAVAVLPYYEITLLKDCTGRPASRLNPKAYVIGKQTD